MSLRGVKRRSLVLSGAKELLRLPRASPSQRLRRIATLPLVARKDNAKVFNAFVLIFVLSAIIITIRHWISRGQMMNPPLPPFRKVGRRRPKPDYGAGRMGGFESCFLGR